MTDREALEKIAELLGIDRSKDAYYNLMGARIDMDEGMFDGVVLRTVNRVEDQIGEVRALLKEVLKK